MTQLTHDEIALFASQIWEKEGKPSGRDEEIWLQAEAQLFGLRKIHAESSQTAGSKNVTASGNTRLLPEIAVVKNASVKTAPATARMNGSKR
ncbi:MAG: DUF2934 domain-containing protein [Verrucomicrobiota bacterium]